MLGGELSILDWSRGFVVAASPRPITLHPPRSTLQRPSPSIRIRPDYFAAVAGCERFPSRKVGGRFDRAHRSIGKGNRVGRAKRTDCGKAPESAAVDIWFGVIRRARRCEGALQETPVHPTPAAIGCDVLIVLKIGDARFLLQVAQLVGSQKNMLPSHHNGLLDPIAT